MKLHYLLAATCIASAAAACTSPTPPVAAQQPAPSAQADAEATPSVTPAETTGVRIPAAELRQRVLKLMDSLHSAQDTNAPQVAKAIGMDLKQNAESDNAMETMGMAIEGWPFYVDVTRYGTNQSSRISLYLYPQDAIAGKVSKTCSFEWNAFVEDIEKMGFVFEGRSQRMGISDEWSYGRGAQAIYLQQYTAKDDTETEQACIYSIIME